VPLKLKSYSHLRFTAYFLATVIFWIFDQNSFANSPIGKPKLYRVDILFIEFYKRESVIFTVDDKVVFSGIINRPDKNDTTGLSVRKTIYCKSDSIFRYKSKNIDYKTVLHIDNNRTLIAVNPTIRPYIRITFGIE
jgi:hypothetical protein